MPPKARHPARQLNSKAIKDAVLSYVVPAVQKKFCIVSAKCVWRVENDPGNLRRAWNMICEKREECDNALKALNNVAFFFSAVASCDTKEGRPASKNDEDLDNTSSQGIALPDSSSNTIDVAVEKGRFPAISYWMALETPNGAPVSVVPIRRKLIACQVEIDTKMLTRCRMGVPQDITKSLSTVLKDHNSSYMRDIVGSSYRFCVKEALSEIADAENHMTDLETLEDEGLEEYVLRFCIPKTQYWPKLMHVLKALERAGLRVLIRDVEVQAQAENTLAVPSQRAVTTDATTQLINDIERVMAKLKYAISKGEMYRLEPTAKYTYARKCSVVEFIGTLEGNEEFKTRLVQHGEKLKDKLKNPESQLIHQLEIDYSLIEVNQGWCLSLSSNKFIFDAIPPENIGKVSPRAFVAYDHAKEPEPGFFKEILENSLSDEEQVRFCKDFLGLLQHQKKTHKQKVPCLIGAADSGKTSLFAPILKIVPPTKIARVTKQRAFNKAMITNDTEVIFIDEAHVKLMDVDDWKILTQGGWTAHDVKFSTARGFINKCPMLVACQEELQFDDHDVEAMDTRLNKYFFQPLPRKDPSAFNWIKDHAIDVIVWAMQKSNQYEVPHMVAIDEPCDHGLSKEEQEQLFQCSLEESDTLASPSSEDEREQAESDPESDDDIPPTQMSAIDLYIKRLRRAIACEEENSFRGVILRRLLETAQARARKDEELMRQFHDRNLQQRRSWLIELGIDEEDVLEVQNSHDPLPTPIQTRVQQELRKAREKEIQEKKHQDLAKIRNAFGQGQWLRRAEIRLYECVEIANSKTADASTRLGAQGSIEIMTEKLKNHHKNLGTLHMKEALIERRRTCVALGLLKEKFQHLVTSLIDPLPFQEEDQQQLDEEQQQDAFDETKDEQQLDEEQDTFQTPPSSPQSSPGQKRKITNNLNTRQHKKRQDASQNSILDYFN